VISKTFSQQNKKLIIVLRDKNNNILKIKPKESRGDVKEKFASYTQGLDCICCVVLSSKMTSAIF
jgi:hypothetical protein